MQLLRLQNQFLRQEYSKVTGLYNINVPDLPELERLVGGGIAKENGLFPSIHGKKNLAGVSHSFDAKGSAFKSGAKIGGAMGGVQDNNSAFGLMQRDYNAAMKSGDALSQLDNQLGMLRQENAQMRYQKELINREFEGMMYENTNLSSKLANLEKVFIGESVSSNFDNGFDGADDSTTNKKYSHSLLVSENNELRARIEQAEQEKLSSKVS